MNEPKEILYFLGIDPYALRTVIKYIYTHDKTLFTEDNMAEVMQLADFLQCTLIIKTQHFKSPISLSPFWGWLILPT